MPFLCLIRNLYNFLKILLLHDLSHHKNSIILRFIIKQNVEKQLPNNRLDQISLTNKPTIARHKQLSDDERMDGKAKVTDKIVSSQVPITIQFY